MKKQILACLAGTYLLTGIGYAAPVVDVVKGDTFMDVSYNRLDVDGVQLNLDATELTLTHGLNDKFALSTGVTFTGNETVTLNNHKLGDIETNIYDLKLQYKLSKEIAPFIGYKKWEIDYNANPFDLELASQSGLQYGIIYNQKIADKTSVFALASFGNDIKEYKLGLAYDVKPNCTAEINYKKLSFDTHYRDFDAKGLGFGVTYKF